MQSLGFFLFSVTQHTKAQNCEQRRQCVCPFDQGQSRPLEPPENNNRFISFFLTAKSDNFCQMKSPSRSQPRWSDLLLTLISWDTPFSLPCEMRGLCKQSTWMMSGTKLTTYFQVFDSLQSPLRIIREMFANYHFSSVRFIQKALRSDTCVIGNKSIPMTSPSI